MWNTRQRLVEELDSDEDGTDTQGQGVGLASSSSSSGNARFASDTLRFTGVDMGDGGSLRSRRRYPQQQDESGGDGTSEDDDSEQDSDLDDDTGSDDRLQVELRDQEDALVEAALARIRRAQAKGKENVKLSKNELSALERRRERLNAENSRKKRREQEPRIAVPISQLDPLSFQRDRPISAGDPRRGSIPPGASVEDQERNPKYPPMGYFPPPSASRTRPRSGTSASQRPPSRDPALDRSRGSSPFQYSYVQPPNSHPSNRHISDPMTLPRMAGALPNEDDWPPALRPGSRQSQSGVDPFLYMTGGPRTPHNTGSATPRRNASGSAAGSDSIYMYGVAPGAFPREATSARPSGRGSGRVSPEETSEETASEEDEAEQSLKDVARQETRPSAGGAETRSKRGRRREEVIVVEDSPEPEPEPGPRRQREQSSQRGQKKSASTSSPTKRKPVASGSSGRRRKGK